MIELMQRELATYDPTSMRWYRTNMYQRGVVLTMWFTGMISFLVATYIGVAVIIITPYQIVHNYVTQAVPYILTLI